MHSQTTEKLLVVRRSGKAVPKHWGLKAEIIKQVRLLDETVRFPFMDLPHELRNIVCRVLFLSADKKWSFIDNGEKHAFLRTSKQIYEEATKLIHLENYSCIKITDYHPQNGSPDRGWTVEFSDKYQMGEERSYDLWRQLGWWEESATSLLKAPRVRLSIIFEYDSTLLGNRFQRPRPIYVDTNNFLYALCSFLSQNEGLSRLDIDIDITSWPPSAAIDPKFDEVLWPLVKLPSGARTTCIKGLPDALTHPALAQIHQGTHRTDHWHATARLVDCATALLDCLWTADYPEAPFDRRVLGGIQGTLHELRFDGVYWNTESDALLRDRLRTMETEVRAVYERMRARLPKKKVSQKLLRLIRYMSSESETTDDGSRGHRYLGAQSDANLSSEED